MEPFTSQRGVIATLDRANVDTDQIIPKQFLKSIKRTGFGSALFSDWRYNADGSDNADFILNKPKTQSASILVGRNNFGCGSSREHAVWAVAQQGFKVVIAPIEGDIPGFADIFRNNCSKNGVLTVQLSSEEVDRIFELAEADEPLQATVNLEEQTVTFGENVFAFDTDQAVKKKLLLGLDDIGESLMFVEDIESFEAEHNSQLLTA